MPVTLSTGPLEVLIDEPGEGYRGSRFDWTTQVRQVTLDGVHTFLTREKEAVESPADQGWGLAGEFGIETALGYDDCPVGGLFPKLGVGTLRRPDDEAYRFHRPYEVVPARFTVRPEGGQGLLVTASAQDARGFGWVLKRHWEARGSSLALTTTLANTGARPLATEEYIHNFVGFDDLAVDPSWVLTLPRSLVPSDLSAWVDPEALMVPSGAALSWGRTPTRDFFLSDRSLPTTQTWALAHRVTGARVSETVDFPVSHFNLWGRGHVVSPELYRRVEVRPGAVLTWSRRWDFSTSTPGIW